MRILVVCQHYWPEPYKLADVCEELVKRGHTVDVVTGVPNYPMGYIYKEYRNRNRRHETHNGVNIFRTFTIGRRNNIFCRFLNYISYAVSSSLFIRSLKDDYDAVLAYQTSPVTMSLSTVLYKKRTGKNVLLYCLDLWPASLSAGGIKSTNIIYKVFGKISKKIYTSVSSVAVSSEGFIGYMNKEFGILVSSINYIPQYAENIYLEVEESKKSDSKINLAFAGNIGTAQSMPTIIKAAQILKDDKDIIWNIIGDGSELEKSIEAVENLKLTNVIFHGRKSLDELIEYYKTADAMLVTLISDENISLTLPAKVQSYMAASKPLIVSADGAAADVVTKAKCGFCAPAENPEKLAQMVKEFKSLTISERKELGNNSRDYYLKNFDRDLFFDKLEKLLYELNDEE
ncbi:MAG: glycosyltransferase family 4 protein [Ruminococcus sp.]|nr:glycosyltransferase family 4 protein [Ruminococcus sp.]